MPRHREATEDEAARMAAAKRAARAATCERLGVVDDDGRAMRRAVAVSNRNLGTNAGHVAWQRGESPRLFRILEDPTDYRRVFVAERRWGERTDCRSRICSSSTNRRRGPRSLRDGGRDLSDEIEWATFGQRIVRGGRATPIEEIVAPVLRRAPRPRVRSRIATAGEGIAREIYAGYPEDVRGQRAAAPGASAACRVRATSTTRSACRRTAVIVLQREGTIEEIAAALIAAGAEDGLILDNGGSVACWVWWANDYAGGIVSPTVDYRPPGTSAIVFVLKGPVKVELPGGSVSYSTW